MLSGPAGNRFHALGSPGTSVISPGLTRLRDLPRSISYGVNRPARPETVQSVHPLRPLAILDNPPPQHDFGPVNSHVVKGD